MNAFESIILGMVQGLTEFLPISSTTHLRIIPALMCWNDPGAAYTAVIQLGTVIALLIYFRRDLLVIAKDMWDDSVSGRWNGSGIKLGGGIIAGTFPIAVLGLLFKDEIENELRGLNYIAISLILFGILLWLSERSKKRELLIEKLGFWQIQIIGLAQACALIPGASRSGVTLTAALFIGMNRAEGARFSFLLGIPAVTAAGIFELKDFLSANSQIPISILLLGIISATISGLFAIDILIKFLKTKTTTIFSVYRILLGAAMFIYFGSAIANM